MRIAILVLALVVSTALLAAFSQNLPPGHPEIPSQSPHGSGSMTPQKLEAILRLIDSDLESIGASSWEFAVEERRLVAVADANADRMRLVTPIIEADKLDPQLYERMMQANYDAALDARYAVAQGMLWGLFVHPLSDLTPEHLVSGVLQTYQVAETFGTTFSSGAIVFGGGDSNDLHHDLLEKLHRAESDIPI